MFCHHSTSLLYWPISLFDNLTGGESPLAIAIIPTNQIYLPIGILAQFKLIMETAEHYHFMLILIPVLSN